MATIILKCTERCNAECVYCEAVRCSSRSPDMSLLTLEAVLARVNDFLLEHPEEEILLTWHGGEPLLLGADYFRQAARLLEARCSETRHRIRQCMQSNLTLLTDEVLAVLLDLGVASFGTSYDPAKGIRGLRPGIDSEAYNRAFLRGVGTLDEHGMGWGFIYVVTKDSLENPLPIFSMLSNLQPGTGFTINPVVISDEGRRHYAISPVEYADFLGAIFPTWYAHRDRYAGVEPFTSMLSNAQGNGRRLTCEESGTCVRHHFGIDPDGDISQCGRSMELQIMQWGNVHEVTLDEVLLEPGLDELVARSKTLRQTECADCRLFPICHGGCPIDSYVEHGSFERTSQWCSAKRRFVLEYFEPVTGLRIQNLEDYL